MFNKHPQRLLTTEEIEVRVWAAVVVIVTFILAGIVMFMLYSLSYVSQPIKSMAPMDQAFAKMLNDIVLLIVGGIGGVMSKKGVQAVSERMATAQMPLPQPQVMASSATPMTMATGNVPLTPSIFDFNFNGFKNPDLDESWVPPPPPTTPADHLEPDDVRSEIAAARAEQK